MNPRKLTTLALVVCVGLMTGNCFQILHVLALQPDGSIAVRWRVTLPAVFQEMESPGPQEQPSPADQLAEAIPEMKAQLEEQLGAEANVQVTPIESEQSIGYDIQYSVENLSALGALQPGEAGDGMTIVPEYDREKNELRLTFTPQEEEKPETETSPEQDQSFEQIARLMLAGAMYDLVLTPGLKAESATIVSTETDSRTEVPIIDIGDQQLIRFPFLDILSQEKKGFTLVMPMMAAE